MEIWKRNENQIYTLAYVLMKIVINTQINIESPVDYVTVATFTFSFLVLPPAIFLQITWNKVIWVITPKHDYSPLKSFLLAY